MSRRTSGRGHSSVFPRPFPWNSPVPNLGSWIWGVWKLPRSVPFSRPRRPVGFRKTKSGIEPAAAGVLACGFIVRAFDAATYYYVHFDRSQAILVRSDPSVTRNELKRVGGLKKPAGQWHDATLECHGDMLKVHLNGSSGLEMTSLSRSTP